jgi:hypothetical protein
LVLRTLPVAQAENESAFAVRKYVVGDKKTVGIIDNWQLSRADSMERGIRGVEYCIEIESGSGNEKDWGYPELCTSESE